MEQVNSKFNWKKIIVPCIIILIPIVGTICANQRRRYVEENGVWSIMTVDKVQADPRGTSFSCHYKFRDKIYKNTGGMVDYSDEGKRFFFQLVPAEPEKVLYSDYRVPSWFTLEAPPEGWKSRPTETELRRLQNEADSVMNMESK